MDAKTISKVVLELTGPVQPVAETHVDNIRFQNLEKLIIVVDHLRYELAKVLSEKDSKFASVKKAANRVQEWVGMADRQPVDTQ